MQAAASRTDLAGPFRRVCRRPDLIVGLFKILLVALVFGLTPLSMRSLDRVVFGHLADSFGAGVLSCALTIFVLLLLRRVPPEAARPLRLGWWVILSLSTLGLLFAFAHPARTSTSWVLQALLLSSLAWSALLALLLPALGLLRWRDLAGAAWETTREWSGVFLQLLCGGYLLTIVRVYSPEVHDPLLFKMDASLGWRGVEAVASYHATHAPIRFLTDYGYPLLGFFVAAVGAWLHLGGARAALRRYLLAVVLVPLFGITCYWVVPAVGPWYIYRELLQPGAGADPVAQTLRAAILAGPDLVPFKDSVARNVMPSLHATFTLVALAAAWRHGRRGFVAWLPLGFLQIATTLTHGVHYVVDLFAAVPLAVLCWSLAEAGARRFPPDGAAPLPPLRDPDLGALVIAGAVALSLGALVLWGKLAPIPPPLAWILALLVVVPPVVAAWRTFAPGDPTPCPPARRAPTARAPGRLLAGAVFCTGGTALVLEQVAEKYLSTLLGSSRPAATLVLVVYFVGLALGAALCPKKSAGAGRRLAALELFVAAWCALLALGFFAADRPLGEWLAARDSSALGLGLARTAIAVLWLLPPTIAMGAQLPTLAAVLRGQGGNAGASLPRLYALNLARAAAFCFAAPPLLFQLVGANGALWFAAVLGGFVGLALWSGLPACAEPPPTPETAAPCAAPTRPAAWPLLGAFCAGLAFFALEVVWFHLIGAICGASTYSFSLLLGLILLGLALAGRLATRPRAASLPALLAGLALALALVNPLWPWIGRALSAVNSVLQLEWFWSGELLKTLAVGALILPPAALLGRIFPTLLRDHAPDGRQVGRLSLANTLGCVTGALLAGLVLVPRLGAERTLLAAGLLAAALALMRWATLSGRARGLALAGVVLPFVLPAWDRLELTRGHGVYLAGGLPNDSRLVWFQEDFHAGFVTVAARTGPDGKTVKTLLQNGKFDADDAGEVAAQASFGMLAALHAPKPGKALVIGCGSGQSASVLACLGFARVDIAELSPAHIAAARDEFSHLNAHLFSRPGVAVHLEDGRNFLLRTRAAYDVIQIEITSLWFAGATNLYSREFYALARSRLAPGGALLQWVQLHHLGPREIATVLATARAEFPHVALWRAGGQACLVATIDPPRPNVALWQAWLAEPGLAAERAATGLISPEALAETELLTPPQLDALLARHAGAYGLNTDRNRWLEFHSPKYYLSRADHQAANLRWIESARTAEP